MFEVKRTKNDNKTIIDDLGLMTREELIYFASQYIGEDTTQYGNIFKDEKDLLDDINYIEENGDELWFETRDTNIKIIYKVGD